jgi:hypothetical protein
MHQNIPFPVIENRIYKTFQVSSDLFWGYRVQVDVTRFDSVAAIIDYIKSDMRRFLSSKNLQNLVEKLNATKFHIHHPFDTYSELLNHPDRNMIIYVCDHC